MAASREDGAEAGAVAAAEDRIAGRLVDILTGLSAVDGEVPATEMARWLASLARELRSIREGGLGGQLREARQVVLNTVLVVAQRGSEHLVAGRAEGVPAVLLEARIEAFDALQGAAIGCVGEDQATAIAALGAISTGSPLLSSEGLSTCLAAATAKSSGIRGVLTALRGITHVGSRGERRDGETAEKLCRTAVKLGLGRPEQDVLLASIEAIGSLAVSSPALSQKYLRVLEALTVHDSRKAVQISAVNQMRRLLHAQPSASGAVDCAQVVSLACDVLARCGKDFATSDRRFVLVCLRLTFLAQQAQFSLHNDGLVYNLLWIARCGDVAVAACAARQLGVIAGNTPSDRLKDFPVDKVVYSQLDVLQRIVDRPRAPIAKSTVVAVLHGLWYSAQIPSAVATVLVTLSVLAKRVCDTGPRVPARRAHLLTELATWIVRIVPVAPVLDTAETCDTLLSVLAECFAVGTRQTAGRKRKGSNVGSDPPPLKRGGDGERVATATGRRGRAVHRRCVRRMIVAIMSVSTGTMRDQEVAACHLRDQLLLGTAMWSRWEKLLVVQDALRWGFPSVAVALLRTLREAVYSEAASRSSVSSTWIGLLTEVATGEVLVGCASASYSQCAGVAAVDDGFEMSGSMAVQVGLGHLKTAHEIAGTEQLGSSGRDTHQCRYLRARVEFVDCALLVLYTCDEVIAHGASAAGWVDALHVARDRLQALSEALLDTVPPVLAAQTACFDYCGAMAALCSALASACRLCADVSDEKVTDMAARRAVVAERMRQQARQAASASCSLQSQAALKHLAVQGEKVADSLYRCESAREGATALRGFATGLLSVPGRLPKGFLWVHSEPRVAIRASLVPADSMRSVASPTLSDVPALRVHSPSILLTTVFHLILELSGVRAGVSRPSTLEATLCLFDAGGTKAPAGVLSRLPEVTVVCRRSTKWKDRDVYSGEVRLEFPRPCVADARVVSVRCCFQRSSTQLAFVETTSGIGGSGAGGVLVASCKVG